MEKTNSETKNISEENISVRLVRRSSCSSFVWFVVRLVRRSSGLSPGTSKIFSGSAETWPKSVRKASEKRLKASENVRKASEKRPKASENVRKRPKTSEKRPKTSEKCPKAFENVRERLYFVPYQ